MKGEAGADHGEILAAADHAVPGVKVNVRADLAAAVAGLVVRVDSAGAEVPVGRAAVGCAWAVHDAKAALVVDAAIAVEVPAVDVFRDVVKVGLEVHVKIVRRSSFLNWK